MITIDPNADRELIGHIGKALLAYSLNKPVEDEDEVEEPPQSCEELKPGYQTGYEIDNSRVFSVGGPSDIVTELVEASKTKEVETFVVPTVTVKEVNTTTIQPAADNSAESVFTRGGNGGGGAISTITVVEEYDSQGMPWDERIHSSKRTRLKSTDCWKPMRGVDKELVAKVEAENKAKIVAPDEPLAFEVNADGEVIVSTQPFSYDTLMSLFIERQKQDPNYTNIVQSVLKELGFGNLPFLAEQPDKAQLVYNRLQELWQG